MEVLLVQIPPAQEPQAGEAVSFRDGESMMFVRCPDCDEPLATCSCPQVKEGTTRYEILPLTLKMTPNPHMAPSAWAIAVKGEVKFCSDGGDG